jgi:hypothetical protein
VAERADVDAQLAALSWQQREGIEAAIRGGRAVESAEQARLAADVAALAYDRHWRIATVVLFPICLLALVAMFVWLASTEDDFAPGGAVFAAVVALSMMGLIWWSTVLRPVARSRQANLHLAGLADDPPPRRDRSNWVTAFFVTWPIAGLASFGINATGFRFAGAVSALVWVAVLVFIKRALDERHSA